MATFNLASGSDLGHVTREGSSYPPTGSPTWYFNQSVAVASKYRVSSGSYGVNTLLLKWDTSSLPDNAAIQSASLVLSINFMENDDGRHFLGDYQSWTGSSVSDWSAADPASPIFDVPLSNLAAGTRTIPLSDFSGINKTGTTYIRGMISGGAPPLGHTNQLWVNANIGSNPQLVVNYVFLPTVDFSFATSYLHATFTDTSSQPGGSIVAWSWNFGDGTTSTSQNPIHTYASEGTYAVTLTATDNAGVSNSTSKNVTVHANRPPAANFTFATSFLTANFTDISTDPDGTLTAWSWNFGDNTTSTQRNPTHTYAGPGTYTVRLTVTDDQGATNFITYNVTVVANKPPTANFNFTTFGLAANFVNQSTDVDGVISSLSWNFGDNSPVLTATNPAHTYAADGTYTVTLIATDDQGATATISKPVTVAAIVVPGITPTPPGIAKSYLKKHIPRLVGVLSTNMDSSQSSIPLNDLTYWPYTDVVLIGSEKLTYSGKSVPNGPGTLLGATRGQFGTTAASHSRDTEVWLLGRHDGGISTKRKIPTFPTDGALTLQELRRHEDSNAFAWVDFDNFKERVQLTIKDAAFSTGNVSTTLDEGGTVVTRSAAVNAARESISLAINAAPTFPSDAVITLNGQSQSVTLSPAVAESWQVVVEDSARHTAFIYIDASATGQLDPERTFNNARVSINQGDSATTIATKLADAGLSGWTVTRNDKVVTYTASEAGDKYFKLRDSTGAGFDITQLRQGSSGLSTATQVANLIRNTNFRNWQTGGTGTTVTFTSLIPGNLTGTHQYDPGITGATSTLGMQVTNGSLDSASDIAYAISLKYTGNSYWDVAQAANVVQWTAKTTGAKQDAKFSDGDTGVSATLNTLHQGSSDVVAYIRDSSGTQQSRRILANLTNSIVFNLDSDVSGGGTDKGIVSFWGSFGTDPMTLLWRVEELDLTQYRLGEMAYGVTFESSDALTWEVHTDEVQITDRGGTYYHDHNALGQLIKPISAFLNLQPELARSDILIQNHRQPVLPGELITIGAWARWEVVPTELPAQPLFVSAHHIDGTVTELGALTTSGFSLTDGQSGTSGWVYLWGTFLAPGTLEAYDQFSIQSRNISSGSFYIQELAASVGTTVKRTYRYAPVGGVRVAFNIDTPQAIPDINIGRKRIALEGRQEPLIDTNVTWQYRTSYETIWHLDPATVGQLPALEVDARMNGSGLSTSRIPLGYPRVEYRLTQGIETAPVFLKADRTEFPGGMFLASCEDWYPNTGVDVRVLPSGRIRRQKTHEPVGFLPAMSLMTFRLDAVRYLQERWGTELFVYEAFNERLLIKLSAKPEFSRQTIPYGRRSTGEQQGYWTSSEVSAEVIEVQEIQE